MVSPGDGEAGRLDAPVGRRSWTSLRRTASWLVLRARVALREAPVCVALAGWSLLIVVLVQALPGQLRTDLDTALLLRPGALLEHPWTALTSLLVPASPHDPLITGGLIANLAVLLLVGVAAERRLGSRLFLLVTVLGQAGAAVVAAVFAVAVIGLFTEWSTQILGAAYVGPAVGVTAAAAAASAGLTRLWRRRVVLAGLTGVITMALYHGGAMSVLVLAAVLIGLALGRWRVRRAPDTRPLGSRHEARVLVSLVIAAGAVGPLVGALSGFGDGPLSVLGGFIARPSPEQAELLAQSCSAGETVRECVAEGLMDNPNVGLLLLTCIPTLLLLIFSLGLRRGRRFAWVGSLATQGTLAFFVVSTYGAWLSPLVPEEGVPSFWETAALLLPALAPVALMTLLIVTRGLFTVPGTAGCLRSYLARVATALAGGLAAYVIGGLLVSEQWTQEASALQLAADFPRRLVPLEYLLPLADAFPALLPNGPAAMTLYSWLGVLTWLPILLATALAVRHGGGSTGASSAARELLITYGGGSLAWMGLWDGNQHWLSSDGLSYVAYRVIGGVAVTTGDLVGPVDARDRALTEFLRYADDQGWTVCFYSATADLRSRLARRGWSATQSRRRRCWRCPAWPTRASATRTCARASTRPARAASRPNGAPGPRRPCPRACRSGRSPSSGWASTPCRRWASRWAAWPSWRTPTYDCSCSPTRRGPCTAARRGCRSTATGARSAGRWTSCGAAPTGSATRWRSSSVRRPSTCPPPGSRS